MARGFFVLVQALGLCAARPITFLCSLGGTQKLSLNYFQFNIYVQVTKSRKSRL